MDLFALRQTGDDAGPGRAEIVVAGGRPTDAIGHMLRQGFALDADIDDRLYALLRRLS